MTEDELLAFSKRNGIPIDAVRSAAENEKKIQDVMLEHNMTRKDAVFAVILMETWNLCRE